MSGHDVFISYARSTESTARKLAEALRAEGFSVWRDDDLPPHRAYAEVIEERLRSAAAVVVLWSVDAARSQWVRAEADIARNVGRLVQVRIDEVEPPIPFNQIQCLDFSRWRGGRTTPAWRKLVESISDLRDARASAPAAGSAPPSPAPVRPSTPVWRDVRVLAGGAVAVFLTLIAAGWFVLGRKPYAPEPATLQIADFTAPADLRQAATGMIDQMVRVLSGVGVATARSSGPAPQTAGPLYRLEGDIAKTGEVIEVSSRLTNARTGLLIWSWKFDRSNVDPDNFFRHVAQDSTATLHCAIDDRKYATSPVSDTAFGLYLNACALVLSGGGTPRMLAVTRRLVDAAPDFASAHAMHAIAASLSLEDDHSPAERDALIKEGRAAVDRALALNPRMPKAWTASALLRGTRGAWLERERDLKEAIRLDPNLPPPKVAYMRVLRETGRLREAAQLRSDFAATGDPRDSGGAGYAIAAQYWFDAGDREKAEEALKRLEESFPGTGGRIRLQIAARYDGRADVLAMVRTARTPDPAEVRCLGSWLASQNDTLDAQRKGLPPECLSVDPRQRFVLLARQGDIDSVFDELEPYLVQKQQPPTALFLPELKRVRADPRFLPLVKRLGLSDYWSKSGAWPDFCLAPDRPYDCKRLA